MWLSICFVISFLFSVKDVCIYVLSRSRSSQYAAPETSIFHSLLDKPHPNVVRTNNENLRTAPEQERMEYAMA